MARSISDILEPGGQPIGNPGSKPSFREVQGGLAAAVQMFQELIVGGKDVTPPGHAGTLVELTGVGFVGLRSVSSHSGPPTIDVNLPSITAIRKVKFH